MARAERETTKGARDLDKELTRRGRGAPRELARACGVTDQAVEQWRTGKTIPSEVVRALLELWLHIPRLAWWTAAQRVAYREAVQRGQGVFGSDEPGE